MSAPVPYLLLPGTAAEALGFYASVFGGTVESWSVADVGRDDAPPTAVAHGQLTGGPVQLFAADAANDEVPFAGAPGLLFALLGVAEPEVLTTWFEALAEGGTVVDAFQQRSWGDHDGRVRDRYGVEWVIGYQG